MQDEWPVENGVQKITSMSDYNPARIKRDATVCSQVSNGTSGTASFYFSAASKVSATVTTRSSSTITSSANTTSSTSTSSTTATSEVVCQLSKCLVCAGAQSTSKSNRRNLLDDLHINHTYATNPLHERALRTPQLGMDFVYSEFDKPFVEKFHDTSFDYGTPGFATIKSLRNTRYDGGIGGLFGCTSIIMASRRGKHAIGSFGMTDPVKRSILESLLRSKLDIALFVVQLTPILGPGISR